MILCLCRGLSDWDIHDSIAGGACTVEDLAEACGAGADCGTCCGALERLIATARGCAYSSAGRAACAAGRVDT